MFNTPIYFFLYILFKKIAGDYFNEAEKLSSQTEFNFSESFVTIIVVFSKFSSRNNQSPLGSWPKQISCFGQRRHVYVVLYRSAPACTCRKMTVTWAISSGEGRDSSIWAWLYVQYIDWRMVNSMIDCIKGKTHFSLSKEIRGTIRSACL